MIPQCGCYWSSRVSTMKLRYSTANINANDQSENTSPCYTPLAMLNLLLIYIALSLSYYYYYWYHIYRHGNGYKFMFHKIQHTNKALHAHVQLTFISSLHNVSTLGSSTDHNYVSNNTCSSYYQLLVRIHIAP